MVTEGSTTLLRPGRRLRWLLRLAGLSIGGLAVGVLIGVSMPR